MSSDKSRWIAITNNYLGVVAIISVGIDVSKNSSTICILKPFGEVVKPPYEIKHTWNSMKQLVEMLSSYQEEVRVVLEATPNTINSSVDNAFTIALTDQGIAYRYIKNTANARTCLSL